MQKLFALLLLVSRLICVKGESIASDVDDYHYDDVNENLEPCIPLEECPTLSWLPNSELSSFKTCGEIGLSKLNLESETLFSSKF